MRRLARSTFKGTQKMAGGGSGKGSVPSVGDRWIGFGEDWDAENTAAPVHKRTKCMKTIIPEVVFLD
jgi:hypothetical protein